MQGRELSEAWRLQAVSIWAEVEAGQAAATELERQRAGHGEAVVAAARELAAVFLPDLSAEALARAEQLTGFRGFSRFEPIKAMDKERQKLEADLVSIRADERYQRREYLVGPYGELTRRLEEAKGMLDPWEKDCQTFELLEGFNELLETGYDTPEFSVRWWEARYWRIWAAGDRICSLLGMADFGDDVLPAYMKVRVPRDQWRGRVQEIMGEVRALHELVQRHDRDQARLAELPKIYLTECQMALGRHLEAADPALVESWSPEDRAVVIGARKLAACKAKSDLGQQLLDALRVQLARTQADHSKAQRKADKFSRPKHWHATFDHSQVPPDPVTRLHKVRVTRDKLMDAADRIREYDDYERFDLQNNAPELWYFEMTGRRPSPLCHELRGWYDRNPDACVVRHGGDTSGAVARAAGDLAGDDLGDVS